MSFGTGFRVTKLPSTTILLTNPQALVPIGINNMTHLLAFSFALGILVTCFIALIMPRISPYSVALTTGEKAALENLARKYTPPYDQVTRAKTILITAHRFHNDDIVARASLPR